MFKKNSKMDVGNYRPISVLTSISKILEKAVHIQVDTFSKDNIIIYALQSGFRNSYTTYTCLITGLKQTWEIGSLSMKTLDVQNTFDSVNHEMLCEKNNMAGIENKWFR